MSIRGPWHWLITRPDIIGHEARAAAERSGELKTIENRSWATRFRGEFLIHASAGMTIGQYVEASAFVRGIFPAIPMPGPKALQRGGIVGRAVLVDCIPKSSNPWHIDGWYGFKLAKIEPLPFVPCKGMLQFFEVPADVLDAIQRPF